jgi:flagellar basal body P-ring protein FlgI
MKQPLIIRQKAEKERKKDEEWLNRVMNFHEIVKSSDTISNSQNVKYLQKKSRENAERTERMQRREQEEKVSSIDWLVKLWHTCKDIVFIHQAVSTRASIEL